MFYRIIVLIIFVYFCSQLIHADRTYTIEHERAELLWFNSSIVTKDVYCTFFKANKTAYAFNVTFTTTRDVVDGKLLLYIRVEKLYGSEFRVTPTIFTLGLCKFWKSNTFGMRQSMSERSNFNPCSMKKGFYYLYNFVPDQELFPKFLPLGSYRVRVEVRHPDSSELFKLNWYARVIKYIKTS